MNISVSNLWTQKERPIFDASTGRSAFATALDAPGLLGRGLAVGAVQAKETAEASHGVVQCLSPTALRMASAPSVGLAIWRRGPKVALRRPIAALLFKPPFSHVAQGVPPLAVRALMREFPVAVRPLGDDIEVLASRFAELTGVREVRIRLEHVDDDACRYHHVDAVCLRLLCTYSGLGTEWLDAHGSPHRMSVMQVGIFKGSKFPDAAPRVLHRSPPVSRLPPHRRSRILLCIDQPGAF